MMMMMMTKIQGWTLGPQSVTEQQATTQVARFAKRSKQSELNALPPSATLSFRQISGFFLFSIENGEMVSSNPT